MNLTAYIPVSLAFIMFSMGLSLQTQDFSRLFKQPKVIITGLGCQLIMLPCLALLIATLLQLSPTLSLGLLLLALCPGGVTSNLATHLSRGDTALSISLTALSSIFTVFTLPVILNLVGQYIDQQQYDFSLPLWPTIQQLALLTLLPLAIAMLLRQLVPSLVIKYQSMMALTAALLFCIIIASVWVQQWSVIKQSAEQIGGAVMLLNLLSLGLAYSLSTVLRIKRTQKIAISLEAGLQNSALAVFVAVSILSSPTLAIAASVYSVVMVSSSLCFIILNRNKDAKSSVAS